MRGRWKKLAKIFVALTCAGVLWAEKKLQGKAYPEAMKLYRGDS